MIRAARVQDAHRLREVEIAAGAPFRDLGMDLVADAEPPGVSEFEGAARREACWVWTDDDRVVAFATGTLMRHGMHLDQVSVDPAYAGRRIGARLIAHVESVARDAGSTCLTLTTCRDVPWNAPYYARLGFVPIDPDQLDSELVAIRRHEKELGLDRWPRLAMTKSTGTASTGVE